MSVLLEHFSDTCMMIYIIVATYSHSECVAISKHVIVT